MARKSRKNLPQPEQAVISVQELKNLKGEKMRMYEEYAAGTLSLDNYKNKKQEYDRKIAEVQDKIEQSKVEEAAQSVVPGTVRAAAEQAENFLHGTRLTASMVSAFIENVYVHEGGRIVVQFKYEQSIVLPQRMASFGIQRIHCVPMPGALSIVRPYSFP